MTSTIILAQLQFLPPYKELSIYFLSGIQQLLNSEKLWDQDSARPR